MAYILLAMPPVPALDADRWMDRDDSPAGRSGSFRGLVDPALEAPRRFASFARTTPGLLTIVSTILVVAILAAGGAMVLSAGNRQSQLDGSAMLPPRPPAHAVWCPDRWWPSVLTQPQR